MRRGRSDPSAVILEQLISPLHDLGGSRPRPPHGPNASTAGDKDTDGPLASVADSALDMRVSFRVTFLGNNSHGSLPLDQEHYIYMEAFTLVSKRIRGLLCFPHRICSPVGVCRPCRVLEESS